MNRFHDELSVTTGNSGPGAGQLLDLYGTDAGAYGDDNINIILSRDKAKRLAS